MPATEARNIENGINLDVLQETVNTVKNDPEMAECKFHAHNDWLEASHNRTTISSFYGAKQEIDHEKKFQLDADEPPILAGSDKGATPVEHLLHALASCVTSSIVAHGAVEGIHIDAIESDVEGDMDLKGYLGMSQDVPRGYKVIRLNMKVRSEADPEKLRELADFSPVLNTLKNGVQLEVNIEKM